MSDCLFCKIVAHEIPSTVVAENDGALAFYDIAPQAPVHVLVIPKAHVESVDALTFERPELLNDLYRLIQQVVGDEGIKESGYRVVFNVGADGQMTVAHLHAHVLGGRRLAWPPG